MANSSPWCALLYSSRLLPSLPPPRRLRLDLLPPPGGQGVGSQAPTASALTADNIQLLTKDPQVGKTDPVERMWRWLAEAGPPYDSSPSVSARCPCFADFRFCGLQRVHTRCPRFAVVERESRQCVDLILIWRGIWLRLLVGVNSKAASALPTAAGAPRGKRHFSCFSCFG